MTDMSYRQLGASGLTVSVVGLGCNAFGRRIDDAAATAVVHAALDHGVTLFDTADTYGFGESERMLGAALGSRRDDVVIATKFGSDMQGANGPDWGVRGSRRYIRRAVESSLRRLGTDWIDLYQLHFPDPRTPLEETLAALDELVGEGLVRYVGSSNFAAWQVTEAAWIARTEGLSPFVSAQNKYSVYDRSAEAELIPAAEHAGVGILPYSPLAWGLLTGKYRRGQAAPEGSRLADPTQAKRLDGADFDRLEALERYAAERGVGILDVAIGGLAAQPAVGSVISGAVTAEQVAANVAAGSWEPTADDLAALDAI
ncbi:aryl-alcohol dehydrogenase-like predicted oxidoreductase [Jiangella mangrovi]|uniref:Aryl-alcohol dehydrogenase-like predicted oxidoreductase n=2 Tax=Jiangella mangrovi TaxID=1524084 RepID=A0A7W9GW42_9ACTN|nr:aryl-alcohol dehydrogenase-like predicted oxidoreductase [Jiangella mangrovi]